MRQFAGEPPVEERVGDRLRDADATLAIAEGCTGGLIAALVSSVPGASEYLDRSIVAYSYDSNRIVLGVTREALDEHGAVSAPVARQLARRVRDMADTTWGLAVTGIAGPTGETPDRPIGTTFVGIAYGGPWESESSYATTARFEFDGDRHAVREQMARAALDTLDDAITDSAP